MNPPTAKGEIVLGTGLISAPFWATVLHDVTLIGSAVAAICGAIIGVHGVYRLYVEWRRKHDGRNSE